MSDPGIASRIIGDAPDFLGERFVSKTNFSFTRNPRSRFVLSPTVLKIFECFTRAVHVCTAPVPWHGTWALPFVGLGHHLAAWASQVREVALFVEEHTHAAFSF